MGRIARATVVVVAALVMMPAVTNAEPMMLTAKQMDSITAGALPGGISININVTNQVANAIALALANCGVCIGGAPSASSLAAAVNANASGQQITR
jgi:hypothetical protein